MPPRPFIVFGDDWGGHPSSVQHIVRRIARDHQTIWVNTLGLRPPRLDRRDAERVVRKVRRWITSSVGRSTTRFPSDATVATDPDGRLDLHVISPPMVPWMRPAALRALNRASVRRAVVNAVRRLSIRDPILVTTVPNGVDAAGAAGECAVVYYCVDDFANWPGVDSVAAASLEHELLDCADAVIATSDHLARTRVTRRGPTDLLPHGVDIEHFARASDPATVPLPGVRAGRPVLGYLGLLDQRLDVALVAGVARARPDWDVVFVGPTDRAPDPSLARGNVRFVPAVPYAAVPEVLAGFDVAILPYVRSELTLSINPLKLREYLASGRPVVATSLPEVARFAPYVRIADDVGSFVQAVEAALAGPRDLRAEREGLIRAEGWDARAERFMVLCEQAAARRGRR